MTVPQAEQYYQNYAAQQQAAAQAEAEKLAYERQQDAIKNDLNYQKYLLDKMQTEYNTNKPYYKYGSSSSGTKKSSTKTNNTNDTTNQPADTKQGIKAGIDALVASGAITNYEDYKRIMDSI